MKVKVGILLAAIVVGSIIGGLLLCFVTVAFIESPEAEIPLRPGPTQYYPMKDLQSSNSPVWNPTNPIPVTPDEAVRIGIKYIRTNAPELSHVTVDDIDLMTYTKDAWFYTITFKGHNSGRFEIKEIRVLMNGRIWQPEQSDNK